MRKTALPVLIMLIITCVVLLPLNVHAAQLVDPNRKGSLELDYSSNGHGFSGLEIEIYRVAEINPNGTYRLIDPFDGFPVKIQSITSQKEWRDAANTLAAYITADRISPTAKKQTDNSGKVKFTDLATGIYLVMGVSAETEDKIYRFENFCVFLPRPQPDGTQNYHLQAKPKSSVIPKPEEPEDVKYQVVKLWKDAGSRNQRPVRISVEILKNGILQDTVILNSENNWTHIWYAPEGDDIWTVVEKDVPDAYTVVITENDNVFTITNTRPAPPGLPPKTGDTFPLRSWLAVMSLSGILLMICGILQKRKRR